MGKPKRKKYQPKPKAIKIASYFNKEELGLIKFVANDILKVSERQFVKGAAVEMAQAALNMAQEKANAEQGEGTTDSNAEGGLEQQSDSGGEAVAVSESSGDTTDTEATIS